MAKKKVKKCSFCGAKSDEVEKLFDSENNAMICDECIMNCLNIMIYGEDSGIEFVLEDDEIEQADTGC